MNHLNVFNAYKNKSNSHEDELTRSFLILVKNIPMVQVMFFELIRKEMYEENIHSIASGDLSVEEVHTQLSDTNNIFTSGLVDGRTLVSVIISDDKFEGGANVQNEDRKARYDGVVLCNPSWVFIIENKPSKDNIWTRQLNPNIPDSVEVKIVDKPCCLSWRAILTGLNSLIQNSMLNGIEKVLVEDFIEYVDNEYSWLNPYTTFEVCKGNTYLLDKRCNLALSNFLIRGKKPEVKYHRGWKHYIESGKNTVKQIALDSSKNGEGWSITVWLHAGDTMSAAKESFKNMDTDKLLELKLQGFDIEPNFHVSYRSSNLLWFSGNLTLEQYLRYWKKEYKNLRQIKRPEFMTYFDEMEASCMIGADDRNIIQEKIMNKNYPNLNICPGFTITYTWDSKSAIKLDKCGKFEEDFMKKVNSAFAVIGGI
ncbi:hypothetical protein EHE19_004165 [Ruminiclostridium herbifermentans]|uniref:Uncharacterized protein n=1 Tax=Ruminiclostridium herbifermentans TaxID=2488810 RepID=A0A4U7JDJ4_9FIRM|nr:hypothetical protein [Ruminiclostridium herbifermentans]QNU67676.1 hypothetical protein EHE19_004165 [Ruminiclostridium herbifermentans]